MKSSGGFGKPINIYTNWEILNDEITSNRGQIPTGPDTEAIIETE